MSTIYVYFSFVTHVFVFFRNHCLSGYTCLFSYELYHLVITLSSLIYFELIFYIWWDLRVQFHPSPCGYPGVLALFVEGIILSFIELLWHACQKSMGCKCKNLFWDSYFHSLELYVYTYMLQNHTVL